MCWSGGREDALLGQVGPKGFDRLNALPNPKTPGPIGGGRLAHVNQSPTSSARFTGTGPVQALECSSCRYPLRRAIWSFRSRWTQVVQ